MCRYDQDIVRRVKGLIRQQLSARHVPAIILETKDIPVSTLLHFDNFININFIFSLF